MSIPWQHAADDHGPTPALPSPNGGAEGSSSGTGRVAGERTRPGTDRTTRFVTDDGTRAGPVRPAATRSPRLSPYPTASARQERTP